MQANNQERGPIQLSDTEALLAAEIVYLVDQLRHMRYALGGLLHDVYGDDSPRGTAFRTLLYPEPVGNTGICAAEHEPVACLRGMVQGRSLAQAMGGKEEAAALLAKVRGQEP